MRTASCTCSSGSISILPASLQQKPGGSMNRNSPRRAFESRAARAALPHQAEFVFRHRALQAEQQTVVDDSRIVRAFGIDDERPRQRAQIDQVMPVPPVARQPRRFDAIDGADVARAHHRHQPLEAGAFDRSRSRPAEIVVDHRHRFEARRARGAGQVILPALALQVADDLRHRRLPHIDDRRAGEVISRDLGAHDRLPRCPRLPSFARRAPRAGGRPAPRSVPSRSGSPETASDAAVRDPTRVVFDPVSFSWARIASFGSEGRDREPRFADLLPAASRTRKCVQTPRC